MKPIMILGTGSHVGKSTLVAGLCRLFTNRGLRVAPFKSQNMSLNSFVTDNEEEIARSIAVQAIAAKTNPHVHMNPILIKPKSDFESQLIVHGKVFQEVHAEDYFSNIRWKAIQQSAIEESLHFLHRTFDLIIAEGAGSCAEPNFQSGDFINMGMAHLLDADVYLVTDIDQGGVFASLLGTFEILREFDPLGMKRVKGIIINKFRGSELLLQPALDYITRKTGIPITGVLPYLHDLYLEEEDRVNSVECLNPELDIAIVSLPHLSNASDFNPLSGQDGVRVRFVRSPSLLGSPDLIILPGTKNTTWDLQFMRDCGWELALNLAKGTTPIFGICGGLEMMGQMLHDPLSIESSISKIKGLGWFDFKVYFCPQKIVKKVRYQPTSWNPFASAGNIEGYEIHAGRIEYGKERNALYACADHLEGIMNQDQLIFGTFIHDLFKNQKLTHALLNFLRHKKGLLPKVEMGPSYQDQVEKEYEKLAHICAKHLSL